MGCGSAGCHRALLKICLTLLERARTLSLGARPVDRRSSDYPILASFYSHL
jgi:hypothetical protein